MVRTALRRGQLGDERSQPRRARPTDPKGMAGTRERGDADRPGAVPGAQPVAWPQPLGLVLLRGRERMGHAA